ncbi:hypothetical protein STEG23_027792, partial [Scotinomys teguina]
VWPSENLHSLACPRLVLVHLVRRLSPCALGETEGTLKTDSDYGGKNGPIFLL